MSMKKKVDKTEKRRLHRLAIKERERLAKDEQDDELSLKEAELPEEPEVEDITKCYGYGSPVMSDTMSYTATSWEELDAEEADREQFEKVREVGGKVQNLVSNIIYNSELDVPAKAEAIKAVADGFYDRCEEEMMEEEDDMEKDLDLLAIKSVQAHDRRNSNLFDNVGDVVKAVLTARRENALKDSQFGLVTERDGKKVRKYPIHDKSHVRSALSRAAQMIKRGGEAATDAKAALPKIHAAAKRMGIGVSKEHDQNAITIEKDLNGDWRWLGWYTNNFKDRDGDIISESAHKEYVNWLDNNMDMAPVSLSWHTAATKRENPVDFVSYENGFVIVSGKLTEKEAEGLIKASLETELGMSHGSFVLGRDPENPHIITKYRTFEVSDLPLDHAANSFTTFTAISKEADMDKLQYLTAILGEEKAKAFLEKTGMKQKELVEEGIEHKEAETPAPVTPEAPPQTETPAPDPVAEVLKAIHVDELNAFVAEAKEMKEKVETLEALVKELSVKQEEKLAEMIEPPAKKFLEWASKSRASQAPETEVKEGDALKDAAPQLGWLNELTGTTPLK